MKKLIASLIIAAAGIAAVTTDVDAAQGCGRGWHRYHGHCFRNHRVMHMRPPMAPPMHPAMAPPPPPPPEPTQTITPPARTGVIPAPDNGVCPYGFKKIEDGRCAPT